MNLGDLNTASLNPQLYTKQMTAAYLSTTVPQKRIITKTYSHFVSQHRNSQYHA